MPWRSGWCLSRRLWCRALVVAGTRQTATSSPRTAALSSPTSPPASQLLCRRGPPFPSFWVLPHCPEQGLAPPPEPPAPFVNCGDHLLLPRPSKTEELGMAWHPLREGPLPPRCPGHLVRVTPAECWTGGSKGGRGLGRRGAPSRTESSRAFFLCSGCSN